MAQNPHTRSQAGEGREQAEYGPLGPGQAPANDPLKGLRGVMAGTHIMEAIVILSLIHI